MIALFVVPKASQRNPTLLRHLAQRPFTVFSFFTQVPSKFLSQAHISTLPFCSISHCAGFRNVVLRQPQAASCKSIYRTLIACAFLDLRKTKNLRRCEITYIRWDLHLR